MTSYVLICVLMPKMLEKNLEANQVIILDMMFFDPGKIAYK